VCVAVLVYNLYFDRILQVAQSEDEMIAKVAEYEQARALEVAGSDKNKLIVILTESRSGSTWLGSIFEQIEEVMYVFEPLDPRVFSAKQAKLGLDNEEVTLRILSSICTCNFGVIPALGRTSIGSPPKQSKQSSYDLYKEYKKGDASFNQFCSTFEVRMAKCIRLYDIDILSQLAFTGCADLKVIHLVRDPRAVIRSRMVTFHELYSGNNHKIKNMNDSYIQSAARQLCDNNLHNMNSDLASWSSQYHLVKYEDLVTTPLETVQAIYNFTALTMTDKVEQFVVKSTQGKSTKSNFKVIKDSKAIMEKWKSWEVKNIRLVEEVCNEYMERLGYELFEDLPEST